MATRGRSQFLSLAEQHMNRCRHFNGIMNDRCEIGIAYADVRTDPNPGHGYAFPCLRDIGAGDCPSADFPTQEEAEAHEREATERVRRWSAKIAANICPTCDRSITKRQIGRCVYGSCGHRLYQGTIR